MKRVIVNLLPPLMQWVFIAYCARSMPHTFFANYILVISFITPFLQLCMFSGKIRLSAGELLGKSLDDFVDSRSIVRKLLLFLLVVSSVDVLYFVAILIKAVEYEFEGFLYEKSDIYKCVMLATLCGAPFLLIAKPEYYMYGVVLVVFLFIIFNFSVFNFQYFVILVKEIKKSYKLSMYLIALSLSVLMQRSWVGEIFGMELMAKFVILMQLTVMWSIFIQTLYLYSWKRSKFFIYTNYKIFVFFLLTFGMQVLGGFFFRLVFNLVVSHLDLFILSLILFVIFIEYDSLVAGSQERERSFLFPILSLVVFLLLITVLPRDLIPEITIVLSSALVYFISRYFIAGIKWKKR